MGVGLDLFRDAVLFVVANGERPKMAAGTLQRFGWMKPLSAY